MKHKFFSIFFVNAALIAAAVLFTACPPPDSEIDPELVDTTDFVEVKKITFDDIQSFTITNNDTVQSADQKTINDYQRGGELNTVTYDPFSTEQNHTTGGSKSFKWAGRTIVDQKIKFEKIFTPADVGRTFSMSLWVYSTATAKMRLGVFSVSGLPNTPNPTSPLKLVDIDLANTGWNELKWDGYQHENAQITQLGIYQASGSVVPTFYIDDIVIKASPTGTP